jgi:prevent-host-death family protein
MDESVPATELRSNLALYLDEVRAGATFVITRGSRVAGRLVPPDAEEMTFGEDEQ